MPQLTAEHITALIALLMFIAQGLFAYLSRRSILAQHTTVVNKIDENTGMNVKQIDVANHVNEKLIATSQLATDANKEAVAANKTAVGSVTDLQRQIAETQRQLAEIKGMLTPTAVLTAPPTVFTTPPVKE